MSAIQTSPSPSRERPPSPGLGRPKGVESGARAAGTGGRCDARPPPLRFSQNIPCLTCGYELRGITLDRPCPECGSPSLDSTRSLHCASTTEVHALRVGARLVAIGAWVLPVAFGTTFLVTRYQYPVSIARAPEGMIALLSFLSIAGPVRTAKGYRLLTSKAVEPLDAPRTRVLQALRALNWLFAILLSAGLLGSVLISLLVDDSRSDETTAEQWFITLLSVTWCVRTIVAQRFIRRLGIRSHSADRVRLSASISRLALLTGIGAVVFMLILQTLNMGVVFPSTISQSMEVASHAISAMLAAIAILTSVQMSVLAVRIGGIEKARRSRRGPFVSPAAAA